MQKVASLKVAPDDQAELNTVIHEYDLALRRVLKRISKNQKAIDRLKKETRVILNAIKAA